MDYHMMTRLETQWMMSTMCGHNISGQLQLKQAVNVNVNDSWYRPRPEQPQWLKYHHRHRMSVTIDFLKNYSQPTSEYKY